MTHLCLNCGLFPKINNFHKFCNFCHYKVHFGLTENFDMYLMVNDKCLKELIKKEFI